ncbi:helix-turn-helix domain-containing protein [Spongiactinospora sp. TRM90649]|uniref:helix-turn-helix domain-containing protein n=1 Tax=Spongiactinospora sp. TRM90649 TaxID=3031114 RepID=UPI0023F67895|nr:helix-turn-helix domain-containing protein [Spongiactinospora sp. TRM90649]MDF5758771.1 helix-turn-helix domain-containing protein [Spongiactinospora sp. TRM90649]
MTTEEVAAFFKVDPETVRVWARTGKIQASKNPGGRVFVYRRVDVESMADTPAPIETLNASGPAGAATPAGPEINRP